MCGSLRPNLSAIICTCNRAPLLAGLLGALCRQTLPAQNSEVIVVDDSSIDDTLAVAAAYASWLPLRYSYQRDNGGLASARNCGLFRCRGDILLFLDDDNMPAETLLEEHLKMHRQFPAPRCVLGISR
ncbi:MAG: glycosyltransferase family A protein [Nitrosospira sp.]